jgi:hypothetical protein
MTTELSQKFKGKMHMRVAFDRHEHTVTKGFSQRLKFVATVNQHPPVHHQGWMICEQETVLCWVPVPYLTMVVSSVGFIYYLPTR